MKSFTAFKNQRDGSVAVLFGATLLLVAGAVGGAVDYSNATKTREALQSAIDASVLAAARLGAGKPKIEYTRAAEAVFMASSVCAKNPCVAPKITVEADGSISADADLNVKTFILDVVGVDEVPISVTAKAMPPTEFGVDVMMVLDYSGSMNWNNKYISMANAAKDFIDRADARSGDNMRVGIVPFSEYVLTPLRGQYAFDVTAGAPLTGVDIVGCTLNRQFPHSVSVDTPSPSDQGSLWPVVSYTTGGASNTSGYSDSVNPAIQTQRYIVNNETYGVEYYEVGTSTGFPIMPSLSFGTRSDGTPGLILDGANKFAVRLDQSTLGNVDWEIINSLPWTDVPTTSLNGYGDSSGWETTADGSLPSDFDAHQLAEALAGSCATYADRSLWARPLSTEFQKLKDAIDKMKPLSATNIALGLDFGWHYLSTNKPFSEGSPNAGTKRSLVLLSDGTQTVAAHGESGAFNIDSANQNITKTCTAAKATGVEIYAIAFGLNDQWTRDLLKNCSTGEPYYFEPKDGTELDKVFDDIFDSVAPSKPRITG